MQTQNSASPLVLAIRDKRYHLIKQLVNSGMTIELSDIKYACRNKNPYLLRKLLMYKIVPTNYCFTLLITNNSRYISTRTHNNTNIQYDANTVAECIDILIAAGYRLTVTDIETAVQRGYYVNNINRLGLNFTDSLLTACANRGFYPYDTDKMNLKMPMSGLRAICKRGAHLELKKMCKKYNIKPDQSCLQSVCAKKNSLKMVKILCEDYGLKLDLRCMRIWARTQGGVGQYIANNMIINKVKHKVAANPSKCKNKHASECKPIVTTLPIPTKCKDKRTQFKVKKSVLKLFDINLQTKMDFFQLRKAMFDYIQTHELMHNKIVTINKPLACALELMPQQIDIVQLDVLVEQAWL